MIMQQPHYRTYCRYAYGNSVAWPDLLC